MSTIPVELYGCDDCPAAPRVARGMSDTGPIWIVIVTHDETCPWAAKYVDPEGSIVGTPEGVLIHMPGVLA